MASMCKVCAYVISSGDIEENSRSQVYYDVEVPQQEMSIVLCRVISE